MTTIFLIIDKDPNGRSEGEVAGRHHFNLQVRLVDHGCGLNRLFSRYFEYSELIFSYF